jgi:hypothetical protein
MILNFGIKKIQVGYPTASMAVLNVLNLIIPGRGCFCVYFALALSFARNKYRDLQQTAKYNPLLYVYHLLTCAE